MQLSAASADKSAPASSGMFRVEFPHTIVVRRNPGIRRLVGNAEQEHGYGHDVKKGGGRNGGGPGAKIGAAR